MRFGMLKSKFFSKQSQYSVYRYLVLLKLETSVKSTV